MFKNLKIFALAAVFLSTAAGAMNEDQKDNATNSRALVVYKNPNGEDQNNSNDANSNSIIKKNHRERVERRKALRESAKKELEKKVSLNTASCIYLKVVLGDTIWGKCLYIVQTAPEEYEEKENNELDQLKQRLLRILVLDPLRISTRKAPIFDSYGKFAPVK